MATILPFAPRPQRESKALVPVQKEATSAEQMLMLDALFYTHSEENRQRIQGADQQGSVMTLYVLDFLQGFELSGSNLELRRQALKSKTLEELCAYLLESTQPQWARQPHFYGAVFVEFDAHRKAVEAYVEKLNDKKE